MFHILQTGLWRELERQMNALVSEMENNENNSNLNNTILKNFNRKELQQMECQDNAVSLLPPNIPRNTSTKGQTLIKKSTNNRRLKICNCTEPTECDHMEITVGEDSLFDSKTAIPNHRRAISQPAEMIAPHSVRRSRDSESTDSTRKRPRENGDDFDSRGSCPDLAQMNLRGSPTDLQPIDLISRNTKHKSADEIHSSMMHDFQPIVRTTDEYFVQSNEKQVLDFKMNKCPVRVLPNNFDRLTDELILEVFKYVGKSSLVRLARVCRRFNKISFDFTLWRRADMHMKSLDGGALGRVIQRGVQYLRLSRADIGTLEYLPPFQSSILFLDLSMANISLPSLEQILGICTLLEKLSLEFLEVNDAVMQKVAQNPSLDTLNLSMVRGLSVVAVVLVLKSCPLIKHLNLAWTGLLHDDLSLMLNFLPVGLERLNLSGMRQELRDRHIRLLTSKTPTLLQLDISDCTEITKFSIMLIVSELISLQQLYLNRCYSVDVNTLLSLIQLPALKELSFNGAGRDPVNLVANKIMECKPTLLVNRHLFSTIARPTVGVRRTSIWLARVRD